MNTNSQSIRFIHSSDWQLGMTRVFLDKDSAPRFSQARIDAITTLGKLAIEHDAQFIIVAGDCIRIQPVIQANADAYAGCAGVFATPEFDATGDHIIVLKDMQPVAVPGVPGVEVVGAPWRTKHPSSDLCNEMAKALEPAYDIIRIAVAHGQVDTLSPDTSRPEIINLARVEQAVDARKLHYLGLG